jgi:hypothetical protein
VVAGVSTFHVVPVNDLIEHDSSGEQDCICGPDVEPVASRGSGLMDTSKVGIVAANLMDDLAKDQAEIGDDQTLGEIMLLAEVQGEDEDGSYTYIRFRCSDDRQWVQRGMLHAVLEQDRVVDEDDED